MSLRLPALLLAMAAFAAGTAGGAELEQPRVHAVQPPAWIERAGSIVALRPGDPLLAGDVVRTGPNGRVQMDLPEGSRIKLGEQVQFRTARYAERPDDSGGFFDAAFDVLKGAFRFTTGIAGRERRRDITFQVGAVTAGIRGTDIWGKSMEDGSDMVLLLEGSVELSMPGQAGMMMDEPAHGVMMMPDGKMRLIETVAADDLQRYASETEMRENAAMMMDGGRWQLIVMSLRNAGNAQALQHRLANAGYPAEVVTVQVDGNQWHRVVLNRLASSGDARMQGDALTGNFGISDYWIRQD